MPQRGIGIANCGEALTATVGRYSSLEKTNSEGLSVPYIKALLLKVNATLR
jgi:hypothetical protein